VIPGEVIPADGTIETLPGSPRIEVEVTNIGDRPVQVGSHFHFRPDQPRPAVRPGRGPRAPPGHRRRYRVRFEPGITRHVALVPLAGARVVPGLTADGGLG